MSRRWGPLAAAAAFSFVLLHRMAIAQPTLVGSGELREPQDFVGIIDPAIRSAAIFTEIGKVIQNPRCLNCHPAGDRPSQTDAMWPHQPLVLRGMGGQGAAGMHCLNCHRAKNFDAAHVPGAPKWALAPPEMAWQGKTLNQICHQIQDPARNGGRSLSDVVHHVTFDELVGWGWHPGAGRRPVPGTQAEFGALVQAWVDSGARCPR